MADAGRQVRGPGVARLRERCRVHVIAGWGFYALDAATGRVLWSWRNGRVLGASPAVIGGTAYFASWDKYLYAFRLPSSSRP